MLPLLLLPLLLLWPVPHPFTRNARAARITGQLPAQPCSDQAQASLLSILRVSAIRRARAPSRRIKRL